MKKQIKEKITANMTIGELIQKHPKAAEILFKEGLMCVMCGMAGNETIRQGAEAHGINVKKLVEKLNKGIK